MKTYAAVQHAPQKISIDEVFAGKYVSQISYWFSDRGSAKAELARLCAADKVEAFSPYVVGKKEVGLV